MEDKSRTYNKNFFNTSHKYSGKNYKFTLSQRMYLPIKCLFDIIISFITICLLSPLLITVSILIKATSKGPVVFSQERVGLHGKVIKIYKFRTMVENSPKNVPTGDLESPHAYITKIGKILRITSIDEIPQLFNVFKGEMSLIGPRPLILNEVKAHEKRLQNGVYLIRPGITGLAQVNGRDFLDIEKKVEFDTAYLHSLSLKMDLYLILKSIIVVFSHSDLSENKKS
ncbi:MAG: Undecaprenyl phosphate N,N'-diacetylbacillosamine 1-phosphate transferase [Eubacteriales bacterium SKADARSKE-1]|nr:Undecaprenyl phosphate N,N'-diacetylbacillosamine 1-phosphate transferase [Eubacteriales bacterium SKADARSKE-1]